jgi:ElaB/YqjD/DUF883 family membrane-anchored ribosome-binding protein
MAEDQVRRLAAGPNGTPGNVAEARLAVASSRERISATIDELEERIIDTRDALRDKIDVTRPVREVVRATPLVAVVAAAGAGLLLGLASRGRRRRGREVQLSESDREAIGRWRRERRQRLLDTAEHELPSFEPPPSRVRRMFRDVVHDLAGAATALVIAQLVERVKEEE